MKSYVHNLFTYIEAYETNYSDFQTEAFLQTFNGIVAAFHSLRTDRNQAVELDYYFLDRLKLAPMNSSDMRQLTLQLIVTRFEAEADNDGRSNQAYAYCRNLRSAKQDVAFFENKLINLVFAEGSLNNNQVLALFFLKEIATYINTYGKPVSNDLTPEAFDGMSEPLRMLELQRRRLAFGTELTRDKSSLEFHLKRVDKFSRLGAAGALYEAFLSDWGYLAQTSFWAQVTAWLGNLGAKFRGSFQSFAYFRLLCTQRKLAYFYYLALIVILLILAWQIPVLWSNHSDEVLRQLQEKANSLK